METIKCVIFSFLLTYQDLVYSRDSDNIGNLKAYQWYCFGCINPSRVKDSLTESIVSLLTTDNGMCYPGVQHVQSSSICSGQYHIQGQKNVCACCKLPFHAQLSSASVEMEILARNGSGVLLTRFGIDASVKQNNTVIQMSWADMKEIPNKLCDFTSVILLDLSPVA